MIVISNLKEGGLVVKIEWTAWLWPEAILGFDGEAGSEKGREWQQCGQWGGEGAGRSTKSWWLSFSVSRYFRLSSHTFVTLRGRYCIGAQALEVADLQCLLTQHTGPLVVTKWLYCWHATFVFNCCNNSYEDEHPNSVNIWDCEIYGNVESDIDKLMKEEEHTWYARFSSRGGL